jgi:hypothetical protein
MPVGLAGADVADDSLTVWAERYVTLAVRGDALRSTIGVVAPLGPGQPLDVSVQQLASTHRPVLTGRASRPSRTAPASSASAIVACQAGPARRWRARSAA